MKKKNKSVTKQGCYPLCNPLFKKYFVHMQKYRGEQLSLLLDLNNLVLPPESVNLSAQWTQKTCYKGLRRYK